MSKSIQIGSAVFGLALLVGVTGTLLATDRSAGPVKGGSCYYSEQHLQLPQWWLLVGLHGRALRAVVPDVLDPRLLHQLHGAVSH